jgi:hypothetical protein
MQKMIVFILAAAMSVASAAQSYKITLFQDSIVNGTTLKAGDYKMVVDNDKATIMAGKKAVEAPVKVETAESKFGSTSVRYQNGDGKYRVKEIRIGGTATKVVFEN